MKPRHLITAVCVLSLASGCSTDPADGPGDDPPAEIRSLVAGNNEFAIDLYRQLAADGGENLICSPYSVSTAVAMVHNGAAGDTAKQIASTLHFPDDTELNPAMKALKEQIHKAAGKSELNVANSLFGQEGYPWDSTFLNELLMNYEAGLREVDFQNKPGDARAEINGWVEQQTKGRIRDIVPEGGLDANTRLVLANAIYFKGRWEHTFDAKKTEEQRFNVSADERVTVAMMHQQEEFLFHDGPDAKALEMPYAGGSLAMLLLLPKEGGLADLENALSPEKIREWSEQMESAKVKTWVPQFKFTKAFVLNDVLAEMGMPDAFDPARADFTAATDDNLDTLLLQNVWHKAFVEVNEDGTEAAAATGAKKGEKKVPEQIPVFRADRPFLFLIRSREDGSILFVGRVTDPTR